MVTSEATAAAASPFVHVAMISILVCGAVAALFLYLSVEAAAAGTSFLSGPELTIGDLTAYFTLKLLRDGMFDYSSRSFQDMPTSGAEAWLIYAGRFGIFWTSNSIPAYLTDLVCQGALELVRDPLSVMFARSVNDSKKIQFQY